MSNSDAMAAQKMMLRGGIAAAAPGLVAVVAATTAMPATLSTYTGMNSVGVAALGVVFFFLAFLFARSRWWAGLPGLIFVAGAIVYFSIKAGRILTRYYQFNTIQSFADLFSPLSVISLHLCLLIIAGTLGWHMLNALRVGRIIGPQPVSKHVWVLMGIWLAFAIWQRTPPV